MLTSFSTLLSITLVTEVEGLRRLVEEQRKLIEKLSKQLQNQQERIEQLEAELRAKKKLKGKPKLSASLLNQPEPTAAQLRDFIKFTG